MKPMIGSGPCATDGLLESTSSLGFSHHKVGMQCVNVNVIRREVALARHIPDHEDNAHQRRGKELGGALGRA